MKMYILDINKFIDANKCKEVTTAQYHLNGIPHSSGLFSTSIFGETSEEQKNMFGYIDLGDWFVHPIVRITIKNLGSLNNLFLKMEHPKKKWAKVVDGKITFVEQNDPDARTGTDFFYKNFEKINWLKTGSKTVSAKDIDILDNEASTEVYDGEEIEEIMEFEHSSITRRNRLEFLSSLSKEEFFINKWLVLPIFYRDMSTEKGSVGSSINSEYKKLIQSVKSLKTFLASSELMYKTRDMFHNLIQSNILINLYNETMSIITGKHVEWKKTGTLGNKLTGVAKTSDFHSYIIGKSVDYATSSVITAPSITKFETSDDYDTAFGYTSIPMAALSSAFMPFLEKEVSDYIDLVVKEVQRSLRISVPNYKGSYPSYTPKEIRLNIKTFIKSSSQRLFPIAVKYINTDNQKESVFIPIYEYESINDIKNNKQYKTRILTWADVIYQCLVKITKDKHVLILRYPVANYNNIYPSKITIASTTNTRKIYVSLNEEASSADIYSLEENHLANNMFESVVEYKDYPIFPNYNIEESMDFKKINKEAKWVDVTVIGNIVLHALGADYDGDMIFIRGLYSIEANKEADELLSSAINVFGPNGNTIRGLSSDGKEPILGAYMLTKN